MSTITIVLLISVFGIFLCLNPVRRRPQHVIRRKELARERDKMPANKWNAGKV
ncbi:MAG: hypothetical protein H6667_06005 [Ardenticatenaceae bacterium]|nr:hypothetical protein [Ardenticatenaceae bacterium]MCB9443745.1 hypothetical protein [Ardenticatenaceae bacterium]